MADPNPWRFRSAYEPFYPPPYAQSRPPAPSPAPWDPPFLPPPPPCEAAEYGGPYKRPRYDYAVGDERRIDLIRFHGGHAPPPPPVAGRLPYHHQAPFPVARPDWRPSELFHTWGGERFSVPAQLPPPPPPPPPLPPSPPSHPYVNPLYPPPPAQSPSPGSFVGASPPLKDYVGVHSHPVQSHVNHYQLNRPMLPSSAEIAAKEEIAGYHFSNVMHSNGHKSMTIKTQDMPKKVDACHLFKHPHRVTRPDHLVVILRGLPGSGKSYLAKSLRDVEVESGGNAPRIHSIDDYFMNEVEKVEEIENSKSLGSMKERIKITKKVMEYCYEPEMEEAYRMSMLKAFKKTLEEGVFTFIIVDDRNLRVADFAQFWAAAKTSGYEVYLLEATYKDPVGCAARNVHGFTLEEVQKMVHRWEEAPSLYLQLDVQSLLHANVFSEQGINEVDMDTEDSPSGESGPSEFQNMKDGKGSLPSESNGGRKNEEVEEVQNVKELGKSKWSEDVEEDANREKIHCFRKPNALSGLMQAYTKGDRSVRWGDQAGKKGFSISASKQFNVSLIIGPGSGYNLTSNPLPEEEKIDAMWSNGSKEVKKNAFLEHQRAEFESFRAVFDRRRRRIGLLEGDD